jgi:hypothetical protein
MKWWAAGGWFALGAAVAFLSGAAIHVFALGQFERIKGPATTFMIFVWLTPVMALLPALLYVLAARMWGRVPAAGGSVVAGAILIVFFLGFADLGERYLSRDIPVPLPWVVVILGSLLAPRLVKEHRNGP